MRSLADQARDAYISARRKLGIDASVAAAAKKLGLPPEKIRELLGLPAAVSRLSTELPKTDAFEFGGDDDCRLDKLPRELP